MYKKAEEVLLSLIITAYFLYSVFFYFGIKNLYQTNLEFNNLDYLLYISVACYGLLFVRDLSLKKDDLSYIIALVISTIAVLTSGNTEFFYPFVSLIIVSKVYSRINFNIVSFIVWLYIFLNFAFVLTNVLFLGGYSDLYIFEPHAFNYYQNIDGVWRPSTSTFFFNSNGAGAAHAIIYLLIDQSRKIQFRYLGKGLTWVLVILSGSGAALLFLVIIEALKFSKSRFFKKHKVICLSVALGTLVLVVYYLLGINPIGFGVRFERIFSFIKLFFSNPAYLVIPHFILNGSFYTESTLLDLFVNYGAWILPFLMVIYRSKARIYLFYLLMTSSALTIFTGCILAILIRRDE